MEEWGGGRWSGVGGGQPDQVTTAIMCAFATHVCPPQSSGAPERARHAGLDTEYPPR